MGFLRSSSKGPVGARAQLLSFEDSKYLKVSVNPGGAGKSLHSICLLRVAPENGQPEFKSQMSVWGNDADRLRPGRWTYVLYDPARPDNCDLDKDRLAKEFEADRHGHPVMVPRDVSDAWGLDPVTDENPVDDPKAKWKALARDPAARQQYLQEQMAKMAVQPQAMAPKPDITDQLTKLADLRDRGVLTQAEFDAQKAKILA